jgi:hypothetical protein
MRAEAGHASYLLVCGDVVLVRQRNVIDVPVRCAAFFCLDRLNQESVNLRK